MRRGPLRSVEEVWNEQIGERTPGIGLKAAHPIDGDGGVGAQEQIDTYRAPRLVFATEPIGRHARIDRLLVGGRQVALFGIARLWRELRRQITAPIARGRGAVANREPASAAGPNGKTPRRADRNRTVPVGDEHVLRRRAKEPTHRSLELVDVARFGGEPKAFRLVRLLEHRPAHREPVAILLSQRSTMREVERIHGEEFALGAAIALDTLLERTPGAVDEVLRRMRVEIDLFTVEVEHVRARVRERPGDVAIEAEYDRREPGDGDAVDVESTRNDELCLVPDRWQAQLEVRVAGEQRLAGRRATRCDRPVVAREGARLLPAGRFRRGARRHEVADRGDERL